MSQYYKKYMKKREEEKPGYAKLFIGAFLVVIVFSAIFMTHSLLSVDTSIGENDEADIKESGLGVKHLIDSRLRFIKMEDESAIIQTKEKTNTLEPYSQAVKEEIETGYNGHLQNSYGYSNSQEKPGVSNTVQTTTVKPITVATPTKSTASASSSAKPTAPNFKTVPVSTPTPNKTYSPAHNIQKNLAPTGMN